MAREESEQGTLAPVRGERRHVSVLFADMVGYTAMLESLAEDRSFDFVQAAYTVLANCVRDHDGSVHAFGGDSVMAVFGISGTAEDAALRACRTAVAMQRAFATDSARLAARFGVRPQIRVGISSGVATVAPVDSESEVLTTIGNTVNLASRIETLAPPDGCLLCDDTRRLIEWQVDLAFHQETSVKGVAKPQRLWRLLAVHENASRFETSLGRGLSPLVGRDEDLATLRQALGAAVAGRRVIDLAAEPGLGKTRLIFEFLSALAPGTVRVLRGHCSGDGRQASFLPFLEVTRSAFAVAPEDGAVAIAGKLRDGLGQLALDTAENLGLLMNLLGLEPPGDALAGLDGVLIGLRTRDLLRRMLAALCSRAPVILVIEDIHWIDTASEELLDSIVRSGPDANLLVIHARRPEYAPGWLDHETVQTRVLAPLDEENIAQVTVARLGVRNLADGLVQQIVERAGGNPLFSEETLHFLIEQGSVTVVGDAARFDGTAGHGAVPTSLLGLLSARLDRLGERERTLLQIAAVIGRRFDTRLLARAAPEVAGLEDLLHALQAQDVLIPVGGGKAYLFKHVLMRDCVYHALLPQQRADLHFTVAQAIEERSEGRLAEAAEALAHHYAESGRADRAFTFLAMAGGKSLGIFALEQADRYFAAALALFESDPTCASETGFARMLADYALCLNLSLSVEPMIALAGKVRPMLQRMGDSRDHVLFLHHYIACLLWKGRYRDALAVQRETSVMAGRIGDDEARAYALVSEMSVSIYCAPMPADLFDATSKAAAEALDHVSGPYLRNVYLAFLGYDQLCRGRSEQARATADFIIEAGTARNDPRALGYGMAMRALIASIVDDYEQAAKLADEALDLSKTKFDQAIAATARCSAIVLLGRPGAVAEVADHVERCRRNGWELFSIGPVLMLGIAKVQDGRIAAGLAQIEACIAQSEREGYHASADWGRLFLSEVYLSILSREGEASFRMALRNAGTLAKIFLSGPKRIEAMVASVKANPQFDPDGHYVGRADMILGLLRKRQKRFGSAAHHLGEARRIIGASGDTPLLARIDAALATLPA